MDNYYPVGGRGNAGGGKIIQGRYRLACKIGILCGGKREMTYVFITLDHEPVFKLESSYKGALILINSASGQLYFNELKGEDLVVPEGPHKGEISDVQYAKEVLEHLPMYSEGEALLVAGKRLLGKKLILGCVADDDYYYQCGRHCILMKERERISRCIHVRWKFEGYKTWNRL